MLKATTPIRTGSPGAGTADPLQLLATFQSEDVLPVQSLVVAARLMLLNASSEKITRLYLISVFSNCFFIVLIILGVSCLCFYQRLANYDAIIVL